MTEEFEAHRAMMRVYPGCIHLNNKGQFRVERLDAENRVALCKAYDKTKVESTYPRDRTVVAPLDADPAAGIPSMKQRRIGDGCSRVCEGRVRAGRRIHDATRFYACSRSI